MLHASIMSLDTYQRKRDFNKTPEPRGRHNSSTKHGGSKHTGYSYVIQKHAAKTQHYDFRLELDGVLKSWAIPKGPSLDPKEKRLAVETEDHPKDYADFEGVIPPSNYGAGTVMVWDIGEWQPEGDARQALAKGKLNFTLRGKRLSGHWSLIKMNGGQSKSKKQSQKQWLLIKQNDEFADPAADPTEKFTASVTSGRGMARIAADGGTRISSGKPRAQSGAGRSASKAGVAGDAPAIVEVIDSAMDDMRQADNDTPDSQRTAPANKATLEKLAEARPQKFPAKLKPQLATLYKNIPDSRDWLHEIKFDGYRLLVMKQNLSQQNHKQQNHKQQNQGKQGQVSLITRGGRDWTGKFPTLARALENLPECVIDGELVYLKDNGVSSFAGLQRILKTGAVESLAFYAFDLPYLQGYDLTKVPLLNRKQLLADLIRTLDQPKIKYSDHIQGEGTEVFYQACQHGLEGIISKKTDSIYQSARTKTWRKIKCGKRQEFVIVGFTDPGGSRVGFGALLLGYHEDGKLCYAGKVGTGFDAALLRDLRKKLDRLERKTSPLNEKIPEKNIHWVRPELVGEVAFTEWTHDNHLRHPAFVALRADKPAQQIVREIPADVSGAHATAPVTATVSSPDKVLYEQAGITKQDLADYYTFIAPYILPYVQRRPLTLVRCPHGHTRNCFFQKHLGDLTGASLKPVAIEEKKGVGEYPYVTDVYGLIELVQIGTLEIHAWGSTIEHLEYPDMLVFDLDPGDGVSWDELKLAAVELREFLKEIGLDSFVRTSGGKGLHVVVPITPELDWDEAKAFCKSVAQRMADDHPKRYVANMSKAKRKNRIFIDYLRNGRGATAICNYSTRGKPFAPVATPLAWNELIELKSAQAWRLDNIRERMRTLKTDPWQGFFDARRMVSQKIRDKVKYPG